MSHYAKVNNGIVEQVIVAENEFFDSFIDSSPGEWIQTSYNTLGGVHYVNGSDFKIPSDDQSKALRKNYASIGYQYDHILDAFIPPKPHNSWILNKETCLWEAPTPFPNDGKPYSWSEEQVEWVEVDLTDYT